MSDLASKFNRASGEWGNLVPEQFKSLDFDFVLANQPQFKSMRFIVEIEDARKSLIMPLQLAVGSARSGSEVSIGGAKIPSTEGFRRELLIREADAFEQRVGRHINGSGGKDPLSHGFNGLKLGQGIGFMREMGMFYFEVQEKLLAAEKDEEMSRKPTFAVTVARAKGLPGDIPVCTVCQNLVTSLIPA